MSFRLGTCLLIVLLGYRTQQAASESLCTRLKMVSHIKLVPRVVRVTYRERFCFRCSIAAQYKTQYVPQTDYKYETEQYCCNGYQGSPIDCQPVCSAGCGENSFCSAPEECSCNAGYAGAECSPVCHGCGNNTYCQSPGVCGCNTGYSQDESSRNCLPVCHGECPEHSICSAPDTCSCGSGYQRVEDGRCQPSCSKGCPAHSSCRKPEECACDDGYESSAEGSCQPVCPDGCPEQSRCRSPGECECLEGFTSDRGSCQPSCSGGCPEFSACLAPDTCVCQPGYVHNPHTQLCEPHCSEACVSYARCVAPNRCECYDGYELAEGACQPKCNRSCQHGYCFAPETCACNSGYLMGPNETCEPQCTPSCVRGKCLEPGICECEPGYSFASESRHVCEPVCEPACQNGSCMAPQLCICHLGYEPTSQEQAHVCRPSCSAGCVNGSCQAPDECACNPGYEPADGANATNICRPSCSAGCPNGDCILPDVCKCWPGYVNSTDGCQLPPLDKLQEQPASNCSLSSCSCWRYMTPVEPAAIECINVCRDEQDKPCMELKDCSCDQATQQLICLEEAAERRLVCQVPRLDRLAPGEAAPNSKPAAAADTDKWAAIVAWSVGSACLLLVVLGASLYLKRWRQRFVVQQQDALQAIVKDEFI